MVESSYSLKTLQKICPALEKELLEEIIETFESFADQEFDSEEENDE